MEEKGGGPAPGVPLSRSSLAGRLTVKAGCLHGNRSASADHRGVSLHRTLPRPAPAVGGSGRGQLSPGGRSVGAAGPPVHWRRSAGPVTRPL